MTNTNTNTNTNWYNTPANYWNNLNWSNTPLNFTTNGLTTNPFTSNPLTTGLTTLVNNTPYTPSVNAYENSDSYVLEFAAPGYNKEVFEVSYNNNTLTVKANVELNERNEKTNYSYREFNYTSFTREFQVPTNANATETRAKYDNGVLTIMLPKTDNTSNTRTIKVS